jgi:hypothetical protein
MKTYDRVLQILNNNEKARNSDKHLIWEFWVEEGLASNEHEVIGEGIYEEGYIDQVSFIRATSPESIRRCRQKIQETHPELRPTSEVAIQRRKKQASKGTFIYREQYD